jgi:hypothetical protein
MNDVILNWKKIKKYKGKMRSVIEDRPYLREQIKKLIEAASLRDKASSKFYINYDIVSEWNRLCNMGTGLAADLTNQNKSSSFSNVYNTSKALLTESQNIVRRIMDSDVVGFKHHIFQ